jgi:hypothetical protein
VKRIGNPLREQAVGGDRVGHVGRLDRDLEVGEVETLHQLHELDCRRDKRLHRTLLLQRVEVLGQGAGVDSNPHRHPGGGRPLGHLGHFLAAADVAGVEADAVGAGVDRLEGQRVVEVDVGDHRDRRLGDDRPQRLGVPLAGHGHANQVRPGVGDLADLLHRRLDVGRLGLGHGLDGDRRTAADRHSADEYLAFGSHMGSVPGADIGRFEPV